MDKKKKTIVAVVGGACIILLIVLFKVFIFPSDKTQKRKNQLAISTPKVDEQKIDRKSKIEEYERESLDNIGKNDVVKGLGNVEKDEEEVTIDESLIVGTSQVERESSRNPLQNIAKRRTTANLAPTQSYTTDAADAELKQLMALQEQLLAQSIEQTPSHGSDTEIQDIQKLMQTYQAFNQTATPAGQEGGIDISQLTPEKLAEIEAIVSGKIASEAKKKFGGKSYFHGAGSGFDKDEVLGLIPAETVDQGILVQGSTIAIRTKKEVRLSNPPVLIPKGAIVYGRVSFGPNRLLIDINSYKKENQLFILDFNLFDFDGVEGIHLDNRTWPKIPAQVAKDVYDYAYQKGTQAATFGNSDSGVNLDEAKDIAILSTTKELGKEVFEKRRVFMPKKYHLWFNINVE